MPNMAPSWLWSVVFLPSWFCPPLVLFRLFPSQDFSLAGKKRTQSRGGGTLLGVGRAATNGRRDGETRVLSFPPRDCIRQLRRHHVDVGARYHIRATISRRIVDIHRPRPTHEDPPHESFQHRPRPNCAQHAVVLAVLVH